MGLGASKIDYKERNFTEQPLDDQEINILLQALPEENIIDSIESEGREKILRTMSDQKVFNIRGDNIFDYYFTNNKEDIKGCMVNQFNRDGTPCPDEKFNRMITKIPDLVKGPLGEKETEWDIEKTNLESKYNTLNTAKTNLQSQYDTLKSSNTDLQNQHDTLNTSKTELQSQYDTLNTSNTDLQNQHDTLKSSNTDLQSQYDTLNTSKTELQSQYDTLNTSKTELQTQYDNLEGQKGDLESEIQKNLLSSVIRVTDGDNTKTVSEQQCKAYAKSLGTTMGKGNDTSGCYLAPHKGGGYGVYYTKKTGRGKCYYNNKNDYRVCIQNNLNINNTYSKKGCRGDVGGEYDCRVDGTWDQITLKGWDRNKYGQTIDATKHFCNTHKDCVAVASSSANWNWPVHTTSKFKPCNKYREVGSGSPDLSITKEECKAHAKSIGRPFYHDSNHAHYALGCSRWLAGNNIYWSENPDASDKKCGHGGHHCIKKEICDPKMNYHEKRECKKPIDGVWSKAVGESCEWECPGRSGVEKHTVPKFHIGKAYACSARDYAYDKNKKAHSGGDRKLTYALSGGAKGHFACRRQDNVHFSYKSYSQSDDRMTHKSSCSDWDNPAMFYKEVVAETVDIDVGSSTGKTKVVDLPHKNMTVSNKPINSKHNDTFEVAVSGTKLTVTRTDSNQGWGQKLVLRGTKENLPTVSEEECKAYADAHGLKFSIHDDTPSSYTRFWNGGCYCGSPYGGIDGRYGSITDERRYTGGWGTANGYTDEQCKDKCLNKVPESKVVQGCSRLPVSKYRSNKKDVVVYVKNAREEPIQCGPSTTGKCIQKQYYKVAGSGVCDKPEDIVPQNECEKAAKSLGFEYNSLGFGNTGEHAQSGCFMDGNILFHFNNKWKGDNYKKVGDYGGRTYLCKR